jgi:hypothetical protein
MPINSSLGSTPAPLSLDSTFQVHNRASFDSIKKQAAAENKSLRVVDEGFGRSIKVVPTPGFIDTLKSIFNGNFFSQRRELSEYRAVLSNESRPRSAAALKEAILVQTYSKAEIQSAKSYFIETLGNALISVAGSGKILPREEWGHTNKATDHTGGEIYATLRNDLKADKPLDFQAIKNAFAEAGSSRFEFGKGNFELFASAESDIVAWSRAAQASDPARQSHVQV